MKQALAHTTDTNEGITAQLQVEPAGHPVAGNETKFFFTFQDPEGTFEIGRCDCVIVLAKDGVEQDRQPIQLQDPVFASFGSQPLYIKIFSDSGMYEFYLEGAPKDGATFHPFELRFDVHVAEASGHTGTHHHSFAQDHLGHIVIFGSGFIIAIILLVRNFLQNRKQKTVD